jgi:hypothetical protein
MSGETVIVYGTTVTAEANGASIANNAIGTADDATYDPIATAGGYPFADIVLGLTFGTAPTEGTQVAVYAQLLDVDGTADNDVPETTRPGRLLGVVIVNNVTTLQTLVIEEVRMPSKCQLYLHNIGTGQSISSGWTAKIKPLTYKVQ